MTAEDRRQSCRIGQVERGDVHVAHGERRLEIDAQVIDAGAARDGAGDEGGRARRRAPPRAIEDAGDHGSGTATSRDVVRASRTPAHRAPGRGGGPVGEESVGTCARSTDTRPCRPSGGPPGAPRDSGRGCLPCGTRHELARRAVTSESKRGADRPRRFPVPRLAQGAAKSVRTRDGHLLRELGEHPDSRDRCSSSIGRSPCRANWRPGARSRCR